MATEKTNFLDMSDEDMANFDINSLEGGDATAEPETVDDDAELPDAVEDDQASAAADDQDDAADDAADPEADAEDKAEDEKAGTAEASEDLDDAAPEKKEETADVVDYKSAYEQIFKPFKANGKQITVANAEDAVSLMQMGANYNLKMSALKPNLKMLKMLENNGLLNEERLSFLIDLDKKDPAAISRLISDSKLDPLDLDAEKASKYKTNTYAVDDREMELDMVLEALQSTPTYTRTLDVVSNKWDAQSKQAIANAPQLLSVINDHMQSGIYDTVIEEVERERMLGRLSNLSDLDAYRKVGDAMNARGAFATAAKKSPAQQIQPKPSAALTKPVVDEAALRDKRRAAGSTKPAGSASGAAAFNPLAMSDEQFSKQVNSRYL